MILMTKTVAMMIAHRDQAENSLVLGRENADVPKTGDRNDCHLIEKVSNYIVVPFQKVDVNEGTVSTSVLKVRGYFGGPADRA